MDGIIILNKEKSMTSHDCVNILRGILKTKKIGHTGTLDPNVTGVLPMCIGQATKLVEWMTNSSKTYEGSITLGYSTETEDQYGKVVEKLKLNQAVDESLIDQTLSQMVGELKQIPPMYSAVRVNGKHLYEYARNNQTIERPVRTIQVYELRRTSSVIYNEVTQTCTFDFLITCSKGTYVRTIATDLGVQLNIPSHMSRLVRISSAGFSIDQAHTLDEIREHESHYLIPLMDVLKKYPKVVVPKSLERLVQNGAVLRREQFEQVEAQDWISPQLLVINDVPIGFYGQHPTKSDLIKPLKMFSFKGNE
ncbi:tRNA pseudouridine(55) synthase TruB [Atopobacter phocae]|uniref:tRNA pseudouridine(55) synthase TruB n=1 Tax=Atopobacter phocae TaxID=136492 RepID=UPI00046E91F5|nr:tRNA pseudouridine(55) synthase TruB [Atopobacter phocae]